MCGSNAAKKERMKQKGWATQNDLMGCEAKGVDTVWPVGGSTPSKKKRRANRKSPVGYVRRQNRRQQRGTLGTNNGKPMFYHVVPYDANSKTSTYIYPSWYIHIPA